MSNVESGEQGSKQVGEPAQAQKGAEGGAAPSMLGNVAGQIGHGALKRKLDRRRLQQAAQHQGAQGEVSASDEEKGGSQPAANAHGGAAQAGGKSHGANAAHGAHGPVQAAGTPTLGEAQIPAAAARGVAGGGSSLPHLDRIQQSFGAGHDVSGVQAHVGGAAGDACGQIGAAAYATGNQVAFAGAPDVHTAAHEAAHVVQQRQGVQLYGGVGKAGDVYERNADAVADRVVAGQSAADLLGTPAGGAGGAGAVQKKQVHEEGVGAAVGAAAGVVAGGPSATAAGKTEHYVVELKAWIPHGHVVDPEEQLHASKWLDDISSIINTIEDFAPPGASARLKYEYHSKYRGDGHTGYAGGYRARSWLEFDWDGKTLSNVRHQQSYGTTHRDYHYRAWLDFQIGAGPFQYTLFSKDVTSGGGVEAKTATSATSGSGSGNHIHLGISSANPVVMTFAPTIDSSLSGHIDAAGKLFMDYSTDEFPSHGIQVTKNGAMIQQKVVEDVSGVTADGFFGAINLARRLTSQDNNGKLTAG